MSLLLFVAGQRATPTPEPVTAAPDKWWPVDWRERQRASLTRYLIDERERLAREAEKAQQEQPTKRAVKRAVERVIERGRSDGLLSPDRIGEARKAISDAIVNARSIEDVLNDIAITQAMIEAAQRRMADDEAAAFLLLAA